jgi:hypothetical protein
MASGTLRERTDRESRLHRRLHSLRHFDGKPAEFWPELLDVLIKLADALAALVAVRSESPRQEWRVLASAAASERGLDARSLAARLDSVAEACRGEGFARTEHEGLTLLAVRLLAGADSDLCVVLLATPESGDHQAADALERVRLVADVPDSYQTERLAFDAKTKVEQLASVLDLMVVVNDAKRFLAASMTFCNELAFRHKCERVSLGWLKNGYLRIRALSHVDRFERKSEVVQQLEQTMEEAFDQNSEVVYGPAESTAVVHRDHAAYSRAVDVAYVASVPLRVEGKPVAVCTFERNTAPFGEVELRLMRLSCDQVSRRLADLRSHDRWFGARLAFWLKDKLGKLIGFEHTGAKLVGLIVAGALLFVFFGKLEYRIKAPVTLRTDDVAYLTAPFDGHIDKVEVRIGDTVEQGGVLLSLDDRELRLQEAALVAERSRYQREFEKSRAQNSLADMRINTALIDQAQARLELVRYQLGKSVVQAPFEGVVVEGDLRERIGAPVEQGEMLFKLARIEHLFAELEVGESDIQELGESVRGEMALAARPQLAYPIEVTRIEPAAVAKEKGNIFIVACSFPDGYQAWWRPGMTGVARISTGPRRVVWILTHRTLDFLRLTFW